uniref:putative wall-associated receptor kinase-like 16 n=1 Tax=Erigeron canadensis TaxID=72917 RepID=UPI001CB8D042|nr:putative wall-associated receptor kinase-like 16 [Erigeron canadensis]
MHLQILVAVVLITMMASLGKASAHELPQYCETSCGNVSITFPFGSGRPGCYHSPEFLVTCNRTHSDGPTLFYGETNIVIKNMSIITGEIEVMSYVASDCYDNGSRVLNDSYDSFLKLFKFQISTKNRFVAIGCDTYAYIQGSRKNENFGTGCISLCTNKNSTRDGSCSGIGCCEIKIPDGMSTVNLTLNSYNNHIYVSDFNPCSYAFVVNQENNHFKFSSTYLRDFGKEVRMPTLLDWAIGDETCEIASQDTKNFLCKGNSECIEEYAGPGYRCRCKQGYAGNPYLKDNCTNKNECQGGNHDCVHKCVDTVGNYMCSCRRGYSGDGRKGGSGCTVKQSLVIMIAICSLIAFILLLILVTWVYVGVKKRKVMMLREKFFKQNGGIMLQQRISKDGGSHDRFRLFTMKDLNKATNNYDESKIIGKGGYGTVYKGILSDNKIVAIKKSKLLDQTKTQIEQFINEVVILSQINHRNVVKLIGCCLEAEIPLLVYEFIPNGTLSDHIHEESKSVAVTWDIRLRIATETAGALSYLHYAASVPIVHRDIKTNNILLDDSYVAKVADFGASKLIPVDQIELETLVRGTLGYLDPEYLQTSQLTDKSDVYSFGVVLVELITGQKALNFDRPEEERSLAKYFLSSLKNGRLFQVLDQHLQLKELPNEIIQVSRIAERCLRVKGDERPTMKEVATELEGIMASVIQKHPWVQSIENEEEGEHLLKQSANYYAFTDRGSGSSSTFDSMSKQITLPAASGR